MAISRKVQSGWIWSNFQFVPHAPSPQIPTTPMANPTPAIQLLTFCILRSRAISISTFSPLTWSSVAEASTSIKPLSDPPGLIPLATLALPLFDRVELRLGNRERPLYQYSTPWPPMNATRAVHSRYGWRPRGEARLNAVIRESDETEASVRMCRDDCVWMVARVRAAREAEGRSARDGRVMVVSVYDVPLLESATIPIDRTTRSSC